MAFSSRGSTGRRISTQKWRGHSRTSRRPRRRGRAPLRTRSLLDDHCSLAARDSIWTRSGFAHRLGAVCWRVLPWSLEPARGLESTRLRQPDDPRTALWRRTAATASRTGPSRATRAATTRRLLRSTGGASARRRARARPTAVTTSFREHPPSRYPFTRSLADRGIALCGSILRVMTRIRCPLA